MNVHSNFSRFLMSVGNVRSYPTLLVRSQLNRMCYVFTQMGLAQAYLCFAPPHGLICDCCISCCYLYGGGGGGGGG